MRAVTFDDWGTVTNSPEAYRGIAQALRAVPLLVGWTDEEGTQLDLLLSWRPARVGLIGSGMGVSAPLMVAVLRHGCFGFDADADADSDAAYYAEKLGLSEWAESSTLVKLAELLNGIRRELR